MPRKGYQNSLKFWNGMNDVNFHFVRATIKDDMNIGQLGRGEYHISAGGFVSNKLSYFMDYAHFNTSQTIFSNDKLNSFFLLPYYQFSTTSNFIEAHYEQHFNGFLTNRIGFMRKLGWTLVGGGHFLAHDGIGSYGEITAGLEGILKILRIDAVVGLGKQNQNADTQWGFRIRTLF